MQNLLLKLVICLFWFPVCSAQTKGDYPEITAIDLPGAEFSAPRFFTGTSLFGYIDGGAELYLEYGFSGAEITEITMGARKYKVEIFRMTGTEEAFGIFSVSKYRCIHTPDLAKYSCQTKYQLQFCKGSYYISIINGTGNSRDSSAMLHLGKIISNKISESEFDPGVYFPGFPIDSSVKDILLAKGRLGIVNGYPDLEDYFKGITGYTAVILRIKEKTILSVKIINGEQFKKFIDLHGWDAVELSGHIVKSTGGDVVRQIGGYHLLIELADIPVR